MKRYAPALAAAAALALAAPAGALAAASYNSNVTIKYVRGGPYFAGRVSSGQPVCTSHRQVGVYRRTAGADPLVGSDSSSGSGAWKLNLGRRPRAGYYYAKAKSLSVGPAANRTVCRAAKSAVTRAS